MDWPVVVLLLGMVLASLWFVDRLINRPAEEAEGEEPDWLSAKLTDRIIVHLKSGQSIRGDLRSITGEGLVLVQAKYLQEGLPDPLEGDVPIPKDNVAFIQRLVVTE